MKFKEKKIRIARIEKDGRTYVLIRTQEENGVESIYIGNSEYGILQHLITANKEMIEASLDEKYISRCIAWYREEYEDE